MTELTRRAAMGSMAVGVTGIAMDGAVARTQAAGAAPAAASWPPAFAGNHQIKPLRFDPAKLTGLSERLITSHWQNNYQGSVKALNMIERRLAAALAEKDLPPVVYGGLKREELHRTGSVILHEVYFDALGGNGEMAGSLAAALVAAFGGLDVWETDFRRSAMSLAGGSGWCILGYNRHTNSLHNYWAWDHMHGAASAEPLLALDMYEHSYHMDYGTSAAKYVDAFMANLDWRVIDARYKAVAG
ncbi:MAG: Fe-Mn family superoxide dismutase [Novosphingobium sp.]|nr:Fe-Mn family superoxide dismutase [Novosphingobium sp.]